MTLAFGLTLAAVCLACVCVLILGWRSGQRLDRRYEKADIRLLGGPFEGERVDRYHAGDRWPPHKVLRYHRWSDETQYLESVYRLDLDGAWRFEGERSVPAPPPTEYLGWGGP